MVSDKLNLVWERGCTGRVGVAGWWMRSGLLESVGMHLLAGAAWVIRSVARLLLRIWPPGDERVSDAGDSRGWMETTTARVVFLAPLAAAGLAAVAFGLHAATRAPTPGPVASSDVVAERFPDDAGIDPAPPMPLLRTASAQDGQRFAYFSPYLSSGAGADPADTDSVPAVAPEEQPQPEQRAEQVPLPRPAPASRNRVFSNNVLNDAQIASIKERLNLTPSQQQMWPAVEAALRNITYSKTAARAPTDVRVHGRQIAAIDPNSAEVQNLKSAAFPMLMSFSENQKQEVRTLTRLMGLEQLASQF